MSLGIFTKMYFMMTVKLKPVITNLSNSLDVSHPTLVHGPMRMQNTY